MRVRGEPGARALPSDLSALAWVLADARTGDVLAAKDAHRPLPPASTLKTLFAITVLPRVPREATYRVTEADLAGVGEGSSRVGIRAGQSYAIADLWRGVFLSSGNDAVHVLARMNGSVAATVAQMQDKATSLGARDTRVISPDGYDAPGQVSSAYDLAVFARSGLADESFAGYCGTASAWFPGVGPSGSYQIHNSNRLLAGSAGVEPYPGLVGVKNGYTSHAGNTLIAAARRGERTLIVTVMNPQSKEPHAVYREARSLLDWGFSTGKPQPVGTLNAAVAPPSSAASQPVTATPQRSLVILWGMGAAAMAVLLAAVLTWFRLCHSRAARDRLLPEQEAPSGEHT